jgi:hypothetical protein
MARCLFWRAKVVLSLTIGTIFFFIAHNGSAQSSINKHAEKLTFSFHALPFQEAIRHLEKITGIHFIYSSNKIPGSKKITLKIADKSLEEVLTLLSSKTNLVFKRKDQYIVIKAGKEIVEKNIQHARKSPESKIPDYTLTLADSVVLQASINKYERPEQRRISGLGLSEPYLKNHLQDLGMYFDTVRLKQLPVKEVRQINIKNRHRGWFISGGLRLSQYSGGAEFRAGIRPLYVVFSPGLIKGGRYHGAYGLGTTLLLKKNLSFNPMYTYFTFQQKANFPELLKAETFPSTFDLAFTARHHQVKLLFQYSFSNNVNIQVGPVFNTLRTIYHLPQQIIVNEIIEPSTSSLEGARTVSYGSSSSSQQGRIIKRFAQYPPQTLRVWLNWEASISYKLNFFKRP